MKVKIIYQEKYRGPYPTMKDSSLPDVHHASDGYTVSNCQLLSAGLANVDGEECEFHDLRVFYKPLGKEEDHELRTKS
jgi:hypothetical protein